MNKQKVVSIYQYALENRPDSITIEEHIYISRQIEKWKLALKFYKTASEEQVINVIDFNYNKTRFTPLHKPTREDKILHYQELIAMAMPLLRVQLSLF